MMEKISTEQFSSKDFNKKSKTLGDIRNHIESELGVKLVSVSYSNSKIIVKAKNNYEAIEIRMKLQTYLEEKNIFVK
jgi:hypothetical protein